MKRDKRAIIGYCTSYYYEETCSYSMSFHCGWQVANVEIEDLMQKLRYYFKNEEDVAALIQLGIWIDICGSKHEPAPKGAITSYRGSILDKGSPVYDKDAGFVKIGRSWVEVIQADSFHNADAGLVAEKYTNMEWLKKNFKESPQYFIRESTHNGAIGYDLYDLLQEDVDYVCIFNVNTHKWRYIDLAEEKQIMINKLVV